jgi:vacuolar-type H+-ATPase subunit I/STV1
MLLQALDFLQVLADIFGTIILYLGPIVSPIGEFMVLWINYVLAFFPTGDWTIYIVIFVILIVSAIIVNSYWPGDKPLKSEKEKKGKDLSVDEKEPEIGTIEEFDMEEDLDFELDEDLLPEDD